MHSLFFPRSQTIFQNTRGACENKSGADRKAQNKKACLEPSSRPTQPIDFSVSLYSLSFSPRNHRSLISLFVSEATNYRKYFTSSARQKDTVVLVEGMDTQKNQQEKPSSLAATSCRKKKHEEATFLEDLKDHIDEFVHASMDEHKTCFKKTMQKMFGLSKVVAEKNSNAAKEVESSLPLKTILQD